MVKRLKIKIFGQVQGVGFRYAAMEKARELGIEAKAINNTDGSVSIEAQGESVQLKKFFAWCRTGPPAAHVERTESSSP